MKIFRHGDLLIKQIKELPDNLKDSKDGNILAWGEQTGHKHQLVSRQKLVFEDEEQHKFIQLKQTTKLIHQEHDTLEIPKGNYQLFLEREYDPFQQEIRQVLD